ncbi:hypothetical protein [Simiduia agarivorans]|uniref:Uncharacterized protein n=1 Tax=Simiduia agarivorans (strain DSM 21679 / JCM 13881 / BCRC 17597 / SA1) TaxID=1117647 RepID=K4KP19_SIMAS|nr:hypothetical protein [Simiduia agarivorans]AFV00925.1 hypothetical protein M5M_18980 [Simiduia agarivorans SA1 = DSM 21679]
MGIALDEITMLESILNERFSKERLKFKMSVHFVKDRMNHPRNIPNISITELHSIFNRLTTVYLSKLIKLKHQDTFNVRCTKTDINIPCAVELTRDPSGFDNREIIAITIMRKRDFKSKDPVEFLV